MFLKKKKKSVSVVKIVLICAVVASAVAAAVTAFILWKKKQDEKKSDVEVIDAALDAELDASCADTVLSDEACTNEGAEEETAE